MTKEGRIVAYLPTPIEVGLLKMLLSDEAMEFKIDVDDTGTLVIREP